MTVFSIKPVLPSPPALGAVGVYLAVSMFSSIIRQSPWTRRTERVAWPSTTRLLRLAPPPPPPVHPSHPTPPMAFLPTGHRRLVPNCRSVCFLRDRSPLHLAFFLASARPLYDFEPRSSDSTSSRHLAGAFFPASSFLCSWVLIKIVEFRVSSLRSTSSNFSARTLVWVRLSSD